MLEQFYDIKFMNIIKLSLLKDFDSWVKKDGNTWNNYYYINGDTFIYIENKKLYQNMIFYGDTTIVGQSKAYELKFLEAFMLNHFLKKHFKLKEQKRIRDMDTIKDDIITSVTIDKL